MVAHELAHAWIGGLIRTGRNADSIVEEPLAEYLVVRFVEEAHGVEASSAEWSHMVHGGYHFYRQTGEEDGAAARRRDEFDSGRQRAALVYCKAPHFYRALEERYGRERVDHALRQAAGELAWHDVSRATWVSALERYGLPRAGAMAVHWWDEAHGDEDLGFDDDDLAHRGPQMDGSDRPDTRPQRGLLLRVGQAVAAVLSELLD